MYTYSAGGGGGKQITPFNSSKTINTSKKNMKYTQMMCDIKT